MTNRIVVALLTLTLSLAALPARAAVVFLDTYDNALAPDGAYALAYPNFYFASGLNGPDGEKAADVDLDLDVVFLRALGYKTLGGIHLAAQAILPVGQISESKFYDETSSGAGDLIFGPGVFLYASEKSSSYVSYWFYAYAPTGAYDATKTINLGSNHWYFEHQLAFNQTLAKKLVFDLNLNLYQHMENPDTLLTSPLRFELAAIAGWQFTPQLVVGLNGGAYWDLDDAELDGVPLADTAASKWAAGPSVYYQATAKLGLTFRWTHDFDTTNDFAGDDVWLRLAYAF